MNLERGLFTEVRPVRALELRESRLLIGAHFGIAIGIVHRESIPDIDPDSDADTGRGVFYPVGAKRDTQWVNCGGLFCRFGPFNEGTSEDALL